MIQVFAAFDMDGSGTIEAAELFELGKARRKLGQKQGEWTQEMNRKMVQRIDRDGDGLINGTEFSTFFEKALPKDPYTFDKTIADFLAVARRAQEEKLGKHRPAAPTQNLADGQAR